MNKGDIRQWKKRIAIGAGMMVLIFNNLTGVVYAEQNEAETKGDICVTVQHTDENGKEVPCNGVSMDLYKVGTVTWDNGTASFAFDAELGSPDLDLNKKDNTGSDVRKASEELEKKVKEMDGKAITKASDEKGEIHYEDLTQGVYLLIQNKTDSKTDILPMLLTLPSWEDGAYNYSINTYPKISVKKENTPDKVQPENKAGKTVKTVKTGDQAKVELWGAVLMGSVIVVGVLLYRSRRKKEKED